MPTLDQINEQIKSSGAEVNFLVKSDVNALPNILSSDESVVYLIQGIYNERNGILVLTSKRAIFVRKKIIGGVDVEDFYFDRISSVEYSTGLLFSEIMIHTAGNKAIIKQLDKKKVKPFVDLLNEKMHKKTTMPTTNGSVNTIEQLEKLAKMRDNGILSDEEFQSEKKKLLNS